MRLKGSLSKNFLNFSRYLQTCALRRRLNVTDSSWDREDPPFFISWCVNSTVFNKKAQKIKTVIVHFHANRIDSQIHTHIYVHIHTYILNQFCAIYYIALQMLYITVWKRTKKLPLLFLRFPFENSSVTQQPG